MGHPKTHDDHEGYEYAMAVMKLCDIIHKRHSTFYLRPDILFNLLGIKKQHDTLVNTIHSLTTKVLRNKSAQMKKSFDSGRMKKTIYNDLANNNDGETTIIHDDTEDPMVGEKNRLAFLDLMLESTYCGVDISETEIKEEVDTIMFEGHDTTAGKISKIIFSKAKFSHSTFVFQLVPVSSCAWWPVIKIYKNECSQNRSKYSVIQNGRPLLRIHFKCTTWSEWSLKHCVCIHRCRS